MYSSYSISMNHEQDEEFSQILEGTDLEEFLVASPDESPEVLGIITSPTIEQCNAEELAALEGSNRVHCTAFRGGLLPGAFLFIFTMGFAVIIRGQILFLSANAILPISFEGRH